MDGSIEQGVSDLQFVFSGTCSDSGGEQRWDNNGGADYTVPVRAEPLPKRRAPRRVAHTESRPLAGGMLHVLDLEKRGDRAGRWQARERPEPPAGAPNFPGRFLFTAGASGRCTRRLCHSQHERT